MFLKHGRAFSRCPSDGDNKSNSEACKPCQYPRTSYKGILFWHHHKSIDKSLDDIGDHWFWYTLLVLFDRVSLYCYYLAIFASVAQASSFTWVWHYFVQSNFRHSQHGSILVCDHSLQLLLIMSRATRSKNSIDISEDQTASLVPSVSPSINSYLRPWV